MAVAGHPARALHRPAMTQGGDDANEPVDTIVRIVTPERISFDYPLAGPFRRIMSYLIDMIVIVAIIWAASIVAFFITQGSTSAMGLVFVASFIVSWGYGAFCEGFFNGRTLGKKAQGLRVVSNQGVPITGTQAILRNLLGSADGVGSFYLIGLASMLFTSRFQRLGDLAAGTMVIAEVARPRLGLVQVRDPHIRALVDRLPARIAASATLSLALSDYVRRRHRFSPGLREEIAGSLAAPLRAQFGLPATEPADAVLCAVYHRLFLGEWTGADAGSSASVAKEGSR